MRPAPEPVLRAAVLADAAAIASLRVRAWQAAYRGMVPDDVLDGLDPVAGAERYRTLMGQARPRVEDWVLARPEGIVGWVVGGPARDEDLGKGGPPRSVGEVYALYLEPAAIGRGHGRRLFAHALERLRALGFREVVVWVLAANARARRFYESAGLALDASAPERRPTVGGRAIDAPEVRLGLTL